MLTLQLIDDVLMFSLLACWWLVVAGGACVCVARNAERGQTVFSVRKCVRKMPTDITLSRRAEKCFVSI
jgi:hypothetical protein